MQNDYIDKEIECECGAKFIWSTGEQKYYFERDYKPPKRCFECREEKKRRNADIENSTEND